MYTWRLVFTFDTVDIIREIRRNTNWMALQIKARRV